MNVLIKNLIRLFDSSQIDALLVLKDTNISYLTGFPSSESLLFVTKSKTFYVTDSRYFLEAQKGLKGICVKQYTSSMLESIREICYGCRIKRLGFEEAHLSLRTFKKLKKGTQGVVCLRSTHGLVESLREVKTFQEIRQIKKAVRLNLEVFKYIKRYLRIGVTEKDILTRCEKFVKSRGAMFSFDPIVAFGPHSCFPHAQITERKLKNNEVVLIDLGIDICGYKSDLTRMFFLGKITHSVYNIYTKVIKAQQLAIGKIKPGVKTSEIDFQARNYLDNNKLGRFFGHSLGHGVGLEIHEGPQISSNNPSILKENMIFTIEPAVYIPNKFGIRIEDMVLVKKDGCEVLSGDLD